MNWPVSANISNRGWGWRDWLRVGYYVTPVVMVFVGQYLEIRGMEGFTRYVNELDPNVDPFEEWPNESGFHLLYIGSLLMTCGFTLGALGTQGRLWSIACSAFVVVYGVMPLISFGFGPPTYFALVTAGMFVVAVFAGVRAIRTKEYAPILQLPRKLRK